MAKTDTLQGKGRKLRVFKTFALGLCLLAWPLAAAHAAPPVPADSPCDPQYYDSLKSRAWMEAQREITQNQNLIFKPDSVLQYTCFDRFNNELAAEAKNMFSQTTRWGPVLPANSMATSLQNLVGAALQSYIAANFTYPPPGGGADVARLLGDRSSVTYAPGPITGGAYNCDVMKKVWQDAKCMDFMSTPGEDGFFTFEQYRDNPDGDHRFLPTRCSTPAATKAMWDTNIKTASIDANTPWTEDNVITYLNRLDPANCSTTSGPNATYPIETGIIVIRKTSPNTYNEKVCIPAGCHYVPTGVDSGNCVQP